MAGKGTQPQENCLTRLLIHYINIIGEQTQLIEVMVNRDYTRGVTASGWWDMPIPEYLSERRAPYEAELSQERL